MVVTNSWKSQQQQQPQSIAKKLFPYVIYAILPLVLLRFYLYSSPSLLHFDDHFSLISPISTSFSSPLSSSFSAKEKGNGDGVLNSASLRTKEKKSGDGVVSSATLTSKEEEIVNNVQDPAATTAPKEKEIGTYEVLHSAISSSASPKENDIEDGVIQEGKRDELPSTCDYTNGEWIHDKRGPLYNGSSCGTIKDGQNCMNHGRPDKGYLYWRWKPRKCDLPRFDSKSFLQFLQGKHLAFVGDSMARNQLESLLCMLGSVSPPNLVYTNGDDNKFRRWHFPSHNVVVSVYWSPFLVKGLEKTNDGKLNHNKLFFDSVDERWASDLDSIDMVVLSIGHWYLHPAVYLDGKSEIGCHSVEGVNCTEIGFYDVFAKAFNVTLKGIIERKGLQGNGIDVIVTTFSPHHFEGDWDKFGACPRIKPFMESEKTLEGMDAEMRKVEVEEVEKANNLLNVNHDNFRNVRIAALDVTKLAMLRPDGHPGPYMYSSPFADGIKERVQNDCVHWCLPGPIDTWNEIMFDIMNKWHTSALQ